MLGYPGHKLVVVFDCGLIGEVRRVAFVDGLGGLGCFGGVIILPKNIWLAQ
jgi:hypothetical protein